MTEEEVFAADLEVAHVYAQKALDALYSPDGPKRSIWYRMKLGRAQSALISLHNKEVNSKKGKR